MPTNNLSIRILTVDDISLIKELCEIDKVCFGDIDTKDQGSTDYWNNINQHCFTFAIFDLKKVIGYLDFIRINESSIPDFEAGKIHDGQLEQYVDKSIDKEINLYVISICLLPEYRNQGLAKALWAYAEKYYKENGYFIRKMYTTIWTKDGDKFFSNFEYKKIAKDDYDHPIISIKLKKL